MFHFFVSFLVLSSGGFLFSKKKRSGAFVEGGFNLLVTTVPTRGGDQNESRRLFYRIPKCVQP